MSTRSEMSRGEIARERFADKLSKLHEEFDRSGVDYRVVGSVAFTALAVRSGYDAELDFDRRGAVTPDQRIPDIDLIFPRADMAKAQELRKKYGPDSDFPIKLGLAAVAQTFDLRPDTDESYLTHKELAVPFDTRVLAPEELALDGRDFIGLSPLALANTYETVGGLIRKKDTSRLKVLTEIHGSDPMSDPDFMPFRDFNAQRAEKYPRYIMASRAYSLVDGYMPPIVANGIKAAALPVANVLKLR